LVEQSADHKRPNLVESDVRAIEQLTADHRQIMHTAEDLLAQAATEPFPLERVVQLRLDLAQAINRHLAVECALLEPLRSNPAHRAVVQRYFEELLALRQATSTHQQRWTNRAIAADKREYRIGVKLLVRKLAARIAWEEEAVLPLLDSPRQSAPAMRMPMRG
jgi:hypothetical protein